MRSFHGRRDQRRKSQTTPPQAPRCFRGEAFPDAVGADGRVDDPERVAYLREHLAAAHSAISAGARVSGYFVWSLVDNFEWSYGYAKRFGIVAVDYATQARTPKASGHFLGAVARSNDLVAFPSA